jgi:PRC-barrel domain
MTTPQQWENMIGLTATDADGDKIGQVGQVYLDEGTGKPEWVTVSTGMFGTRLRDHGVRALHCLRVFGSNPISDYLRAVIAYLPLVFVAIAVVAVGGGGITTMAQRC